MAILGLMSTESVTAQRWTNIRRKVFYQYPNGAAPLIGLLSLMKEEETNDPEFSWWEKRLKEQATTSVAMNSAGAFGMTATAYTTDLNTAITNGTITTQTTGAGNTQSYATARATFSIAVLDATLFRPGHVVSIKQVPITAPSVGFVDIIARVVSTSATGNGNSGPIIVFQCIGFANPVYTTYSAVVATTVTPANTAALTVTIPLQIVVIGSAFPQGVVDLSAESYYLPINPFNYTQIFRTPFSFTGSALVSPVKFDDTGIYKDKAKSHSIDHMIEMEKAFIFGITTKTVPTVNADPTTGVGLPMYTTGGILEFLRKWQSGAAPYNTEGYSSVEVLASSDASDASDQSRIITNSGGTLNEATYDTYLERIFRTSNNVSNEKLVLCGSGFLKVVNQMYRSASVLNYMVPNGDTFGLELVAHKTPFGTIYYKTHPLFSQNATLRYNALFTDVYNLRYRPMSKRDTQLLKNRQPNDADYRKDEWFSEAGLEFRMPETFMYLQNVTSYVP